MSTQNCTYKKQKFHLGTLVIGKRGGNCRCKDMKSFPFGRIVIAIFCKRSDIYYIYTSIPFTSNIQTSRSCRISLESSSFIRLVPLYKSYLREMQRCQDWISPLRVHRRMSMGSGLDRILRRVVMCIDCIVMGVNRRCGGIDHRRCCCRSRC